MGAGGGKLHQHEVVIAGVGLAVEASAGSIPSSNNVTSTVYLRRLGLGRKATQVAQRTKEHLFLGTCELPSCTSAVGANCERIPQTEYIIKSSFQGASGEELCYSVHLVSVQRAGPQQTILKARQHDR